jgi:ubiquinone/menaquinone biosynthesis C-methylase UbiE
MKRRHVAEFAAISGAIAAGYAAYRWRKAAKAEVEKLAEILCWEPGREVADVGAGRGRMTIAAAQRVSPAGHVYSTDVEAKKIESLRKEAKQKELANITAIQTGQNESKLPPECCDAMLLRGSYHHFTDPASMNVSLYRALRPGGLLVVIDFAARRWLSIIAPVKGVPANRGGHGIPRDVLIGELTQAGFEVDQVIPRWFLDLYCVVFRKPEHSEVVN